MGGVLVFLVVHALAPVRGPTVLVVVGTPAGFWLCRRALVDLDEPDPRRVVVDEIVGQWIGLWPLVGVRQWPKLGVALLVGFVVFRVADIVNLFPANRAEELPGAAGVMLDDVVAGIYTFIILLLLKGWVLGGEPCCVVSGWPPGIPVGW